MSMPDDVVLAARWDMMAPQWVDEPDLRNNPQKRYIAAPLFQSLWGDVHGRRVLDAGCGAGWLTRLALANGAVVDAVDFSPALIDRARALDPSGAARYQVADLCDLGQFPEAAFDLVISHCCLQDVRDYRAALAELARVLRPGFPFIISVVHPWTWQFDAHWRPREPGGPFVGFIEDPQYLTERFSGRSMFHRPLALYAQALLDHGLGLAGIREPRPGDELKSVLGDDPRWERWRRVPDFLFFHGRRVSA